VGDTGLAALCFEDLVEVGDIEGERRLLRSIGDRRDEDLDEYAGDGDLLIRGGEV